MGKLCVFTVNFTIGGKKPFDSSKTDLHCALEGPSRKCHIMVSGGISGALISRLDLLWKIVAFRFVAFYPLSFILISYFQDHSMWDLRQISRASTGLTSASRMNGLHSLTASKSSEVPVGFDCFRL